MGGDPPVGVLALQGDFDAHISALTRIGASAIPVRQKRELDRVDRLIIPGGESTTVAKLLALEGLEEEIRRRVGQGMPLWGTCMGLILIARQVDNRPVSTLELMHVTVERNAYGAQLDSFEAPVSFRGQSVRGVFIRAPRVREVGDGVQVIATQGQEPVGLLQGKLLGTTFHPELTDDPTIHAYFLSL